ncbi:MAG: hypothetical protein J6X91_00410 [Bacteroidales bacterium]|nr:hypothetical protein [Bacteroidales bacterium]MBP5517116.1 hypothetical protein [Bacteroidales bacterium]
MRKLNFAVLLTVLASSFLMFPVQSKAQDQEEGFDRNHCFDLYVGDIYYTPKSQDKKTGSKVLDVIASVVTGEFQQEHDGYADAVRAEIVRGLSQAFRFNVRDRLFVPSSDNPEYALTIDGNIASITSTAKVFTEEHKDKNGKVKKTTHEDYRAIILFTLTLKDLNGTIINSNTFSVESNEYSSSSWYSSRQNAIKKAMGYVSAYVARYYDEVYPLTADIIEVGSDRNNKQKEVYIDLGSAHGVYTDLTFGVYQLTEVGNRTSKHYLGRIRVKEIQGPDVSYCKVVSGGKDIKKCLDNNIPLLIISRH